MRAILKRTAIFVLALSFVFALIPAAYSGGYVPIAPLSVPMVVPVGADEFLAADWDDIQTAVLDSPTGDVLIKVTNNIDAGTAITIPAGRNVFLRSDLDSLSLDPHSIFQDTANNRHFIVDGGALSIGNIQLTRTATSVGNGGGINVTNAGQLNMYAGSVISSNTALQGGGVFVNMGTFTMKDGEISGNEAETGGGVRIIGNASIFTMEGGKISGNKATAWGGGGVDLSFNATFIMEGGEISGNEATTVSGGGGVRIGFSTFTMEGGTISGNKAPDRGGGVHILSNATFTMYDGVISGNESGNRGGGVHVDVSTFTMEGGKIIDNKSLWNGGGVDLSFNATFIMEGGEISGNQAANDGGGVHVHASWSGAGTAFISTFTMHDGEISGNTADNSGGGVNVSFNSVFTMHDGIISGNKAGENGGGIYLSYNAFWNFFCFFIMYDGIVSNNTAIGNGGGIFTVRYENLTISDTAIFSGNTAATAHDFFESSLFPGPDLPAGVSGGGDGGNVAGINWASVSIPGAHALNNFDINFTGYEIATQTITFDPNNGMFAGTNQLPTRTIQGLGTYAQAFDASGNLFNPNLAHPTKSGHTFGGWFDTQANADGTAQTGRVLSTDSVTDDAVRTLWARWTPVGGGGGGGVNVTVRFMWNYERDGSLVYHQVGISSGGTVTPPTPPTREGYRFTGWFTDAAATTLFNFANAITSSLDLFAGWEQIDGRNVHHAFIIGYPDGYVRPRNSITRAEVATILFRLISDADREHYWMQTNPFPDVELENWFNNAISTKTNAGVFVGMPDGTFQPNRAVTRAEFAAAVVRFMDVAPNNGSAAFNDIAGHWAASYINAAAHNGWVMGDQGLDGPFRPDAPITRAETAAIINRAFERLPENPEDLLPGMRIWPDNADRDAWYYLYIQEATNSHHYVMKNDGVHEIWVELLVPERSWTLLERPDSRPGDIFS